MNTYRIYCPEIPDKPIEEVQGSTSWEVRQAYARRHNVPVVEVVSLRLNCPPEWSQH
jgi:hypothetical protein